MSKRHTLVRISQHATTLFAGDAAARLVTFVTTVYLARVLGANGLGLLAFAQALLGYLLLLSDWGLGVYGTREIATSRDSGRVWLAVSTLRTGLALVLTLLVIVLISNLGWDERTRWVVGLTLLSVIPLAVYPDWVYRGLEKMRAAAGLNILQALGALVGALIIVRAPTDIVAVPGIRLVSAGIAAAVGSILLRLRYFSGDAMASAVDWLRQQGIGRIFRSGSVLLSANLAVLAYNNADIVILRAFLGDEAVGWYSGAYRIIQLPMAGFYSLTAATLPVFTQLAQTGQDSVTRAVRPLVPIAVGLGLALAVGLWVFRGIIIRVLYGPEFGPAVPVLSVLAWVVPMEFLVALKGTSYIARRQERLAFLCVAVAALVNVLANLILIPAYGIVGAAWATIGAYGILIASYVFFLDPRLARDARVSG